jgi:hypothetical protein
MTKFARLLTTRRAAIAAYAVAMSILFVGGCDPNPTVLTAGKKAARAAAAGFASWTACEKAGACSE